MNMSNQEVLSELKNHKKFQYFLDNLDYTKYPSLDLEKVFYFISTGVLVDNMSLNSTRELLRDIKKWLNLNKRGGIREGAGRPKKTKKIIKITLSAEEEAINSVRKKAESEGTSLQALFRSWLEGIAADSDLPPFPLTQL
jgi:hypothetical protein